jgi:1-acyl-sn-glycerol-3-phosphate acyltransferase
MVGKSWRETAEALAAIAPICTARDKDGVDLYFLNNRTPYTNLTTAQAIQDVFEKNRPFGMTPTGTRLRHILKPYLDEVDLAMKQGVETKPLNVIVITDGVASDDVEAVILEAAKKLEKIEAPGWQVGVQFFQVGQEKGAAEALKELDDDLVAAGCPRDIVDTVPWNKGGGGEGLSADGVLKVVLGSVNRKLDRKRVSGDGPNRT